MISRRIIVVAATSLLVQRAIAEAQKLGRAPRVGVLGPGSSAEAPAVQRQPFEKGLRDLGWIPGSSVVIEYRFGEGDVAQLAKMAADLVGQGVDVIVARGNVAVRMARQATTTIPIVMSSADPARYRWTDRAAGTRSHGRGHRPFRCASGGGFTADVFADGLSCQQRL